MILLLMAGLQSQAKHQSSSLLSRHLEVKMPNLPKKKVGIVACSGEELPEGTVTRLAALKVLEELRPDETVTICLPLFLAGGEGDRAFARFYPTVAVDGCDLQCAARATEMYSGKPAASVVVTDLCGQNGIGKPEGLRKLNAAGLQAVEATADQIAGLVDELLGVRWSRRKGAVVGSSDLAEATESAVAACACGSGIPVQKVQVDGEPVSLIALPLIFEQFREAGKAPGPGLVGELLDTVRVYNPIPAGREEDYGASILREYKVFFTQEEK
jgi:uncharacterized metal-binding protein